MDVGSQGFIVKPVPSILLCHVLYKTTFEILLINMTGLQLITGWINKPLLHAMKQQPSGESKVFVNGNSPN